MAKQASNLLTLVCLAAAQLVTVAFFAWKYRLHYGVIVVLTAGVVVTWFVPRRVAMLVIGGALVVAAAMTDVLDVRSEIGYTAATLVLVTGAVIAWRE
jgi:hypothetical protein